MNKGINLLPNKNAGIDKQKKILKSLRLVSIIVLTFLFISSISLFFITQQFTASETIHKEDKLLENYSKINTKMVKLFIAHDRLSEISKVLEKRFPLDTIAVEIRRQIPQDVLVDAIKITDKEVDLTSTSPTLSSIQVLLDNFTKITENKKIFNSVLLRGIGYDGKEKYFVTLRLTLL